MQDINYDIAHLEQIAEDCIQTAASQLLSFYKIQKTVDEIKRDVPVYINDNGVPLGSSVGHIAAYFVTLGFKVTLHTVDVEIFDRSWSDLTKEELSENLEKRKQYLKHPRFSASTFDVIFDGYKDFLNKGGKVVFPVLDELYLHTLLNTGPVYAIVNRTFLNHTYKRTGMSGDTPHHGSIEGHTSTHVVVIAGYKDGKFKIVDSDYEFGGIRWIDASLLVGSIYLAETEYDSMVISLQK